jgi:5-methylcytosine-specific restriction endonuclease McrA
MPIKDPERRRTYKRRWQTHRRKALKAKLIEYLGGACCRCGFDAFAEGLEFHHIDRSTKNPRLRGALGFRELREEDAFAEAEKCILLCSNCHKGLEAGAITLD